MHNNTLAGNALHEAILELGLLATPVATYGTKIADHHVCHHPGPYGYSPNHHYGLSTIVVVAIVTELYEEKTFMYDLVDHSGIMHLGQ